MSDAALQDEAFESATALGRSSLQFRENLEKAMTMTPLQKVALVMALATLAAGSATAAVASSERTSASLDLQARLGLTATLGGCPVVPEHADLCQVHTGAGAVSGLGAVTESYPLAFNRGFPLCPPDYDQAFGTSVSFIVAGKGEINFALAANECIWRLDYAGKFKQAYTITGGTGIYAGASGTGTVGRLFNDIGTQGIETWTGTLSVPGLEFDVTRPTLTGATKKTVKARRGAKSARVVFRVTATDNRDGTVPVVCSPRSGTAFPIGRTRVTCSATDSSANTTTASFTVTVQRRR